MAAPAASRAADGATTVAPAYGVLERLEPGRLDEQALDCVWADPDLLALEFEAIVSANYPTSADRPDRRPPARRRSVPTGRTPTPHHVGRRGHTRAPTGRRPTRRRAFARERGPPPRRRPHPRPTATAKEVTSSGRPRLDPSLPCRDPATADVRPGHLHLVPEVTSVRWHATTSAPVGAPRRWQPDRRPLAAAVLRHRDHDPVGHRPQQRDRWAPPQPAGPIDACTRPALVAQPVRPA